MTAFAIDMQPRKITVAGDTLVYAADRNRVKPLAFADKIVPLESMNAVAFARGQLQPFAAAMLELLGSDIRSIDKAISRLPMLLQETSLAYAREAQIVDHTQLGMLEVLIIGWSSVQQRMHGAFLANYQRFAAREVNQITGTFPFPEVALPSQYSPAGPGREHVARDLRHEPRRPKFPAKWSTEERLIRTIEAIGEAFKDPRNNMCGCRVGGEITAYTIEPGSVTRRVIHRFDDYDQMAREAADNWAEAWSAYQRGELDLNVADKLVPMKEIVPLQ